MATNFRDALNDPNDPLGRFDAATGPADLSAFDAATGATAIPPGWYPCTIAKGELVTTKSNKPAYRLTLDVSEGRHAGFRMWRYLLLDTPANANRAKATLAPLGLRTGDQLRQPFPGVERVVTVRALVVVRQRPDGTDANDLERFEVLDDRTVPPNRNAVALDEFTTGEGNP